MATKNIYDEYNKRLGDGMGADNTQPTSPTTPTTDDYYKMARDQEYGLLFDKEVALENAKANALKYTQNSINAQGFGGTGYGSSMQSGIWNSYINKVNEANTQTASNIRDINLQEQQANQDQANDRFQSITTMLTQADTQENMDKLLTDYGYGTMDKDGNFVWGEKPAGMSDDDWYQMQYYYRMQKNAFGDSNSQWADKVMQYNEFSDKDGVAFGDIAPVDNLIGGGSNAINDFFYNSKNGDILQFDYSDKQGEGTAYFMFYNGKIYQIPATSLKGKEPKSTVTLKLGNKGTLGFIKK